MEAEETRVAANTAILELLAHRLAAPELERSLAPQRLWVGRKEQLGLLHVAGCGMTEPGIATFEDSLISTLSRLRREVRAGGRRPGLHTCTGSQALEAAWAGQGPGALSCGMLGREIERLAIARGGITTGGPVALTEAVGVLSHQMPEPVPRYEAERAATAALLREVLAGRSAAEIAEIAAACEQGLPVVLRAAGGAQPCSGSGGLQGGFRAPQVLAVSGLVGALLAYWDRPAVRGQHCTLLVLEREEGAVLAEVVGRATSHTIPSCEVTGLSGSRDWIEDRAAQQLILEQHEVLLAEDAAGLRAEAELLREAVELGMSALG